MCTMGCRNRQSLTTTSVKHLSNLRVAFTGAFLPTVAGVLHLTFPNCRGNGETGLDYFGARYYSGAQGRFTSPDAPLIDQNPADPQSWNLFSYVRNNPLRFLDPTGMEAVAKEACAQDSTCVSVQLNVVLDKNADLYDNKGNLLPQYQK